eukprot:SAG11_NODE_7632_length_1119_cov_0.878431_1_plen_188_part_10
MLSEQFIAGKDLLVKPVTAPGTTSLSVYLPGTASTLWYDVLTAQPSAGGVDKVVETPLHRIPVFQRGGSIIPKRMRLRRSSVAMANDPYTLQVAMDHEGSASGDLYLDDGHSYDHAKKNAFQRRRFTWSGNTLSCVEAPAPFGNPVLPAPLELPPSVTVERVLVWGWPSAPSKVTLTEAGSKPRELGF